jgi:hypothetical protein
MPSTLFIGVDKSIVCSVTSNSTLSDKVINMDPSMEDPMSNIEPLSLTVLNPSTMVRSWPPVGFLPSQGLSRESRQLFLDASSFSQYVSTQLGEPYPSQMVQMTPRRRLHSRTELQWVPSPYR